MGYRYLEDLGYADAAFEAEGVTLEEVFVCAADALAHLMVEDLNSIQPKTVRQIEIKQKAGAPRDDLSRLLQEFLEKIIYWKDVDRLLLRASNVEVKMAAADYGREVIGELWGEPIDPSRHALGADVKAVTFHQMKVWKEGQLWKAVVVVDI